MNVAIHQQALTKSINGIVGMMNGDVKVGVVGQQTQSSVEDVHALAPSENIEKKCKLMLKMCLHWP